MLRGFGMSGLGLDNPCDGVNQFLVSPGDGEKTASGKLCLGADRRGKPDTRCKPETRECRKHGQLRGCGRREALTGGPESLRRRGLAPQAGLEPATLRLTAECSTIELLRSAKLCFLLHQTAVLKSTAMSQRDDVKQLVSKLGGCGPAI